MIFRTVTLNQFDKSAEISTIFVRKKGRKRIIQRVENKMDGGDREERKAERKRMGRY